MKIKVFLGRAELNEKSEVFKYFVEQILVTGGLPTNFS